ncbi:TadE/TadG family type IV pilus assembly protein [Streptomyces chartreusis]|uniref:TadE/TadG family type IV pilus assembly protein n=1 Tax=Streptomyces chartreusis TaxID=1969 RepID=UPI003D940670
MAITFPVVLLATVAVVQGSLWFYARQIALTAGREGVTAARGYESRPAEGAAQTDRPRGGPQAAAEIEALASQVRSEETAPAAPERPEAAAIASAAVVRPQSQIVRGPESGSPGLTLPVPQRLPARSLELRRAAVPGRQE